MTLTLHLPPQVEQAYLAEAHARGVSLESLVSDVLLARQPSPGTADITPEQWVEEFRSWVHSHSGENLPLLSDEAISRESIYLKRSSSSGPLLLARTRTMALGFQPSESRRN